jgi:uncharacterized protein (TIGR02996 family)
MSLEDALLHDIIEHPEDDTPRLVYADWLEEQGDPMGAVRAEFIRVQCRLAQLAPVGKGEKRPEVLALQRREHELFAGRRADWVKSLPACFRGRAGFCRGFVEHVWGTGLMLLEYGEKLVRRAPIRRVWVKYTAWGVASVAQVCWLGRLEALALNSNHLTDAALKPLLSSPVLAGLRELSLCRNFIGDKGALALASAAHLSSLRALSLDRNVISDRGAEALLDSPHLADLTHLSLGYNSLGEAVKKRLRGRFGKLSR